jgi:DNA-binding NarL/FixJ family response regulator
MNKIKILIVDDHRIVREGLKMLIRAEADLEVVGEAENGHMALQMAEQLRPELVVLDIGMPLLNGIETARQLCRMDRAPKVLILSTYSDAEYIKRLISSGISGYLLKETAAEDLIRGIREVSRGQAFFSPQIAKNILQNASLEVDRSSSLLENLTIREAEVLQLVAEGFPNKQIADVLGISIKTVEKHRQQAMNKLNIHDTAGLTRFAVASGIIEGGQRAFERQPSKSLN